MEEILQQLIASLSDYPMICRVLYIPGGAGVLPSTVLLKSWEIFLSWEKYESMNKKYYYDLLIPYMRINPNTELLRYQCHI